MLNLIRYLSHVLFILLWTFMDLLNEIVNFLTNIQHIYILKSI